MKKLTESDSLKFKNISAEEKAKRGILGRLYGPVASFTSPTRNGRKYSQELWEQVFNSDLVKERFANGGIAGELCHPEDREEVDFEKIAIIMPEPPVKDDKGQLIAYVDIQDTPAGRIAYQLAKYGYKFGISSRGTGDIIEGFDGDEVDPDTYQLNAFDLVEIPAVESARLTFVESLNTKKYGKTLKESLQKELDKATDEDKKIMTEALDELGIKIEEATHEYITLDDIDEDNYPYLADALDHNFVSLIIYDKTLTNEKFDDTAMEEDGIDSIEVKHDIERYAEHRGLEFKFDYDKSESLETNEEDTIEEEFDPSGYTRAIEAINAGIETDEDTEALQKYLQDIIGYCKSIADDYDLMVESTECGSDKKEVVDDESKDVELVAEFQEALEKVKQLEADNISLQESLSVGNAKVEELGEQLAKYKKATVKLSESSIKTKKLYNELDKKEKLIAENAQRLETLSKSELNAKMKLSEAESELNDYKAQNNMLTEKVNSLSQQLNKSQGLVSNYKKSYTALKENYLKLKVTNYSLNIDDVKQKLGESYKIKDIDVVCKELNEYKTNLNKLPFRLDENTKVKVKPSKEYINGNNFNNDDNIDSLSNLIY